MKLNLDFSLYKGTTMLKNWWKAVKSHFETVQEAHNALDTALSDETAARKRTDTALSAEVTNRTNADNNLQQKITDETTGRVNADTVLDGRITTEVTVRANADTALQRNIDTEMSSRQNAEGAPRKEIVYSRELGGFYLKMDGEDVLTDSEILAVCRAVLSCRQIELDERSRLVAKLLKSCVPGRKQEELSGLVFSEGNELV